jgi:hypothetical protein
MKRISWAPEEDKIVQSWVKEHGEGKWKGLDAYLDGK